MNGGIAYVRFIKVEAAMTETKPKSVGESAGTLHVGKVKVEVICRFLQWDMNKDTYNLEWQPQ